MSRSARWRPWLLLFVFAAPLAALVANTRLSDGSTSGSVRVVIDGRELARVGVGQDRAVTRRRLRIALARVPVETTSRRGSVSITYRHSASATAARAEPLLSTGGAVAMVRWPVASWISAPAIRQALRNTCESGALAILLASAGVRVPQDRIVAELPRSGPLDPIGTGPNRIWGDPELGFVGRPNGGRVAGGFGVYPRPVAAVAARHGRRLTNLTGTAPATLYRRLLQGRAVMVWIGLSNGPYGAWRSPAGRPVTVNFGEHTVVLNGITRAGGVRVVNPLRGTRETWSKAAFQTMWNRLGRRALGA